MYFFHHICLFAYIHIHFSSYGWATTYLQLWGKTSGWRRCWPCFSEIWQKRISFFIFIFLDTNDIWKHPETSYETKLLPNKFQVAFMMPRSNSRSIFVNQTFFFFLQNLQWIRTTFLQHQGQLQIQIKPKIRKYHEQIKSWNNDYRKTRIWWRIYTYFYFHVKLKCYTYIIGINFQFLFVYLFGTCVAKFYFIQNYIQYKNIFVVNNFYITAWYITLPLEYFINISNFLL